MSYLGHMTQTIDFDIHDRCRKARETAGLTQDELADRIEVARQTISNYESRGVHRLRPIVLRQWALACGVDYDWLVGSTETVGYLDDAADLLGYVGAGHRSEVLARARVLDLTPV